MCLALISTTAWTAPQLYEGGAVHPRLLCTADELAAVRTRLDGEVEQPAYRKLIEKCDAFLNPKSGLYVDWDTRKKSYWHNRSGATWLTKCFEELAWAGVLSNQAKYIDGARNIVLTIVRERVIDQIAGTNYGRPYGGWLSQPLDAGHSSRALGIVYDRFTESERAEIRDYMAGTYLSYLFDYMRKLPENDRYPGILGHNFALIGNSAAAVMTLAMWGETGNPEQEQAWLDMFLNGIKQYLDIGLGPDGGALEGAGYTSACLYYLTFPLEALRRAGGEDLSQHPRLRKAFDYYLYEMLPGRNYYNNTNDSFFHAHTCFFPLYARLYNRPELTWMWREVSGRLRTSADVYGDGRNAAQPILNYILLWYGQAPAPKSPDETTLPLTRLFSRRGIVDMRNGWDEDGCLLSFTCGGNPAYGHGQYDSGHFALYCGRSALAGDTGYGGGQSEDHNAVLIDGHGQRVKCDEGRITTCEPGELASYAAGRIGDLYRNTALKRFERHIYFVHDRKRPYAVVYDDIEADGNEHTYTWLLQGVNDHGFMMSGEGIEISTSGDRPLITDQNTGWKLGVTMFAASPPAFSADVKTIRWNPTAEAVPHPRLKAHIRTDRPPDILTVLTPGKDDGTFPTVTRVNRQAVRVEWPEHVDLVAFGPAQTPEAETPKRAFIRTAK